MVSDLQDSAAGYGGSAQGVNLSSVSSNSANSGMLSCSIRTAPRRLRRWPASAPRTAWRGMGGLVDGQLDVLQRPG